MDLASVNTVTQEVLIREDLRFYDYNTRRNILNEFIQNMGLNDKAIVFVERKTIVDEISRDLFRTGIYVQSIHGDKEQCDREEALNDLKTGYVKILIVSDVASRDLDIKDITLILNLYFPHNIEEYVHRVGKIGRAGKTISVFTWEDWIYAQGLIKILEEANQFVPDKLREMADRRKTFEKSLPKYFKDV